MRRLIFFLPTVLCYVLIFFLSSQSDLISLPGHYTDKLVHLAEYALFGIAMAFGYFNALRSSSKSKIAAAFFTGAVLGILDEFHQYFVRQRHCDMLDALADIVGIALGLTIYWLLFVRIKIKRS